MAGGGDSGCLGVALRSERDRGIVGRDLADVLFMDEINAALQADEGFDDYAVAGWPGPLVSGMRICGGRMGIEWAFSAW